MKNLNRAFFLILICFVLSFFAFISSVQSQTLTTGSATVHSTDGYSVNISLTPTSIVAPASCDNGYNFNVNIDYEITFTGNNIPDKLWSLQGNMACGDFNNSFFDLPNKGGAGATTTNGNVWNSESDCATATVQSLGCDVVEVAINGPGISSQIVTINLATALPVELYSYGVKLENNEVRVDWATASEKNNDYFVVERSVDGRDFEEVEMVYGAGNSDAMLYYAVTDRFPFAGVSYYRLKQVDFDGTTTYSEIKTVEKNSDSVDDYGLTVFPNPIMDHSTFSIGLEGFGGKMVEVKIQDMNGMLIYSNEVEIAQGRELIELNASMLTNSGMYTVSIFSNNKWYNHKFVNIK